VIHQLFHPKHIAVIGATDRANSVGLKIFENLVSGGYPGKCYPVNKHLDSLLGHKAYGKLADIPVGVDLAIIAVPAPSVPDIIAQCVKASVKCAIVISSGFRETGQINGAVLEEEMMLQARKGNIRILGPNCMGLMSPHIGVNFSMFRNMALPGNIALVSQSGAVCEAILDWGLKEKVGFSHFISIGGMADIAWGDLLLYLAEDPHTRAILIYMESIGTARRFLSAAREVALNKPIIVIKAGRTETGARVAATHTGTLTGNDEIFDAAFRRTGVLRVETIADLFFMASVLARQPSPRGNRLAIVTNAGGPAVLATDSLIKGKGHLAEFTSETVEKLRQIPHMNNFLLTNPLDITSYASPETCEAVMRVVMADPDIDGALVILTPHFNADIAGITERLANLKLNLLSKPVLASVMGGDSVAGLLQQLNQAGIPSFQYPDTAAKVFNYLWRYAYNLKGIYETPRLPEGLRSNSARRTRTERIIRKAMEAGLDGLSEAQSKEIMASYGLPVIPTIVASTPDEAVELAANIGFPVVLKVHTEAVMHKARAGGVVLNLYTKKAVRKAFESIQERMLAKFGEGTFLGVTVQKMFVNTGLEIILGSKYDEQFGPVLLFGNGGRIVELYRDVALALPPLNTTLARRMMEQTQIYEASKNLTMAANSIIEQLEQILVLFSHMVVDQPLIREIDINPLAVSLDGIAVLDARMVLHAPDTNPEQLTPLAIRPYPANYESVAMLKDHLSVFIRPIRPEDEPLVINFHKTLSDESVYLRYFHPMSYDSRVAHERLTRICYIDYDREIALVAIHPVRSAKPGELVGVGRIVKFRTANKAEFSITISDQFQGKGLGAAFLKRLIAICCDEGIEELVADILPNNTGMKKVCEKFDFKFRYDQDEQVIKAWLPLAEA
jgi:acetyltransferase